MRGLELARAGAQVLPDPTVPGAPAGQWWPPAMLAPAWITAHAAAFDVMHLHFGLESLTPGELDAALDALRAARRPLVYTVHDLSHPQLADQTRHREQLARLIVRADALITLTDGAAGEIASRWGRSAVVLAHPAVHPPHDAPPAVSPSPAVVVGLALRDLRPSIDGPGATSALIDAAARLRRSGTPVQVLVTMRDHVRDPAARDAVRQLCAGADHVTLREGPRPDDAQLARELAALAICVLPYRHGTHSGWLELCWDLGVPVAAPRVGHLADQHPDPGFQACFEPGDAPSLAAALSTLLARPEAVAGSAARSAVQATRRTSRLRQRTDVGAAHVRLYRRLIDRKGDCPG